MQTNIHVYIMPIANLVQSKFTLFMQLGMQTQADLQYKHKHKHESHMTAQTQADLQYKHKHKHESHMTAQTSRHTIQAQLQS